MFGTGSKACLLALVLLLCSSLSFSQVPEYDGPDLPMGWYPIHIQELTALDETLQQQEIRSMELENELTEAESLVEALEAALKRLDQLLLASKRERTALILQRNIAIGAGAAITGIAIYLGLRLLL